MRHTVVMVATSYPRFPGDGVGSFMEPIAKHVAARGHDVHLVAPWHPLIARPRSEDGVMFHFYRYAPIRRLNVFGYAGGMRADTRLRLTAWAAAPLAIAREASPPTRASRSRSSRVDRTQTDTVKRVFIASSTVKRRTESDSSPDAKARVQRGVPARAPAPVASNA